MNPKLSTFAFIILNFDTMENQNYLLWKHAITYAVYLSVALIILTLLFYVFDLYTANWTAFVIYAVLLSGIVISVISFRDKHLSGYANYKQCFIAGFYTTLFASIIYLIFYSVYMYFAGNEIQAVLLTTAEEDIIEKYPEMPDDQLEMTMKFTTWLTTPFWQTIFSFMGILFFGTIFSLLSSIFIKKENKSLEVE
jgi:hypothetical protein